MNRRSFLSIPLIDIITKFVDNSNTKCIEVDSPFKEVLVNFKNEDGIYHTIVPTFDLEDTDLSLEDNINLTINTHINYHNEKTYGYCWIYYNKLTKKTRLAIVASGNKMLQYAILYSNEQYII